VVALALLVLSLITLVEVILAALGRPPALIDDGAARDELARRQWDDPMVILAWVSLLVLGAGLLTVALAAGRQRSIAMDSGTGDASLSVRRRSLERYLAGIATAQPGVRAAKASVTRGRIKVQADSTRLDAQDVGARVQQAVSSRVRSLNLQPDRAVSVSLHSKED
jgi:hypothetical protein